MSNGNYIQHIGPSSRMVERTNQTLKDTLSKWIIKTDCSWMDLLPVALLKLRMTLCFHGYSPYEIVYGSPSHSKTGVGKYASGKGMGFHSRWNN